MLEIPVSFGELFDKITILQIKKEKIGSLNVEKELALLIEQAKSIDAPEELVASLHQVNRMLWDIEDQIRIKEAKKDFGQSFIDLARSVYIRNDERARIKKQINDYLGSKIIEEKQYFNYS